MVSGGITLSVWGGFKRRSLTGLLALALSGVGFSAVGLAPRRYIEARRFEAACRLLEATDLRVWQISELLGYSSIQVFSRAFSRWSGQRQTLFRKKARRRGGKQGSAGCCRGRFDELASRLAWTAATMASGTIRGTLSASRAASSDEP